MMTAPKQLRIGAHIYTFKLQPVVVHPTKGSSNYLGLWTYDDLTLQVKSDMPPGLVAETFIHEVVHALNLANNVRLGRGGMDEEELTQAMGAGLTQFARDNPEAIKWWMSLLKK